MKDRSGFAWLGGLAAGAAAMYFLDPRSGRRRRIQARDQLLRLLRETETSAVRLAHDLENRTRGTVTRTTRLVFSEQPIDGERLCARVRSVLGHLTKSARGIRVEAEQGVVRLLGRVDPADLGDILTGVRRVPGVMRVESYLEPIRRLPEGAAAPALAAGGSWKAPLEPSTLTPASRAMVGTAGGLIALWGVRRGGSPGLLAAALGGWMIAQSALNPDARAALPGAAQVSVAQRTLEVEAPVREVFALWSSFRSFPRFMQHVREVRESEDGSGISTWVADGPAGVPVSWTAEVTSLQPFKRIAWRSLPGSMVHNSGEVQFEELDENRTRIHVRMAYHPPAGAIGSTVATLFGADPERQLEEDLRRLKQLLEQGRVRAKGTTIVREDVQAAG